MTKRNKNKHTAVVTAIGVTPPLDESLAKLRTFGEWYAVSAGPIDEWAGWTWASAYACNDFAAFQSQLDEVIRGPVPHKRVHGYNLFSTFGWLIVTSAMACTLLDRRMPDLSPDAMAFRKITHESGEDMTQLRYLCPRFFCLPDDPHVLHADATVVADETVLRSHFHQQIEQHFPPVIQVIQANTGYIERAMWAQVSDWVIGAVIEFVRLTGHHDQLDPLMGQFAKRDGSPLKMRNGAITLHFDDATTGEPCTDYMLNRASCCQWYRFPEAKGDRCATCPGLSREQRIARMTAYYQEERAKRRATANSN